MGKFFGASEIRHATSQWTTVSSGSRISHVNQLRGRNRWQFDGTTYFAKMWLQKDHAGHCHSTDRELIFHEIKLQSKYAILFDCISTDSVAAHNLRPKYLLFVCNELRRRVSWR